MGALSAAGPLLEFGPDERVGVLGGTFDPIHRAHLHLADAAAVALKLDRMLLIPAGDPWMKRGRPVTAARHRYAMVEAAVRERGGGLEVSDLELRRSGPTYTLDTLRELREAGAQQLWWVLGGDALQSLPSWHKPTELLSAARLAVAARPGAQLERRQLDRLLPGLSRWVDWIPMPSVELSATDLRNQIARGEHPAQDIPPAALAYIRQHNLYTK